MKLIFRVPKKLITKLYTLIQSGINEIQLPETSRYKDLIQSYKLSGLGEERDQHLECLNKCLSSLGLPVFSENEGMYSEHLIIFAALSNSLQRPKNILEIGTYDGRSTSILATLFPSSSITTIDLKDDDPLFISSYNRDKEIKEFINVRKENLENHKNIRFIQTNSIELLFSNELPKQDLIWVDGAHGYPVVAIDITNSIRLLSKDGILMCDDVFKEIQKSDNMYSSIASFETLNTYSQANIINTNYFLKRLGRKHNLRSKFVSFSKLVKEYKSTIK